MAFSLWVLGFLGGLLALRRGLTSWVLRYADRHVAATGFRRDLEAPGAARPGGPVALLVHGTFCDAATTRRWRRALEDAGVACWLYEYRYLDEIPRNAARLERDLAARLAAIGPGAPARLLLVGYSQGGIILRHLLAGRGREGWRGRVAGFVQVASPNAGCEPADLARYLYLAGRRDPAPSLIQMRRGSRLLADLDRRALPADLPVGVIYGVGVGRHVLGRLFDGRPEGSPLTRVLGRIYEVGLLPPEEHDGLVRTASALAVLAAPGREDDPAPVRVETDHLGLLDHPEADAALVRFARRFLGGGGAVRGDG